MVKIREAERYLEMTQMRIGKWSYEFLVVFRWLNIIMIVQKNTNDVDVFSNLLNHSRKGYHIGWSFNIIKQYRRLKNISIDMSNMFALILKNV